MSYKDKYRKRNAMYGNSIREIRVNNMRRKIESTFKNSVSYYQVLMIDHDDNSLQIDAHIVDSTDLRDEKKITVFYETNLSSGSLIYWKDRFWLCTHFDEMSEIYKRGVINRCYTSLKWQDENGVIREAWFSRKTDVSPNFGIDEGSKIITMPDERRQIVIQSNSHTQKIKKHQKFIFDGRAWKVITLDDIADGIINIVLQEDEINPATDNLELRVVNYRPINYSLEIITEKNISVCIDQPFQLDIRAYRNNQPVSINEINLSSTNETVGTVDKNGLFTPLQVGTTEIIAEYMGITKSITVVVDNTISDNFTVELLGGDIINLGQSKEFTVVIKNNGNIVDETFAVSLFADDGINQTNLATIVKISGNIVTLRANSNSKTGYIKLKIKNIDNLFENEFRIRVKSLL